MKFENNVGNIAASLLLVLSVHAACAAPERFVIDAQYRGMVNKTFSAIGSATVDAVPAGNGVYTLTASGQATHPQDQAKSYQTAIKMKVNVSGGRVAVLSSTQQSRPGSERFTSQIQDVMPILTLVRSRPEVAAGTLRSLATRAGVVSLSTHQAGSNVEVTAERGGALVAKFFLARVGTGLQIQRFRVPAPEDNVTLTFVAAQEAAMAAE